MALNETTKKQLKEFLDEEQVLTKNDIQHEHNHEQEHKHNHATRTFDKFCPDCAEPNPDYKEPDYFCQDCQTPIGSLEDAEKSKACYKCGSTDAIHKDVLEEL
jgi:hypothetical protein